MEMVLDFCHSKTVLSPKHYDYKISGNWLAVICRATGKRWIYRLVGYSFCKDQIRFMVKEAQPPKIRKKRNTLWSCRTNKRITGEEDEQKTYNS